MTDRPLPESWRDRFTRKLDELATLMERHLVEHPESRLKVVPRHRISGPQLGERWHSLVGQIELNPEIAERLGKPCADCGRKVILATGDLIKGLYCGPCWGIRKEADDRIPPAA